MVFYLSAFFILSIFTQYSFSCPDGTIEGLSPGQCYLLKSTPSTWLSAENFCMQNGGHLASVPSAFVNSFLKGTAQTAFFNTGTFWLGQTKLYTGQWTWSDGSNYTYDNWANGQPSNTAGLDCLSEHVPSASWYSESCDLTKPFICEVPQGGTPKPISTTKNTPPQCAGENAIYYAPSGKCFHIINGTYSWYSANDYCAKNYGGSLGSIHSRAENDIVAELGFILDYYDSENYCVVFGLYNNLTIGNWTWVDGSIVNYTFWSAQFYEPNMNNKIAGICNYNNVYSWVTWFDIDVAYYSFFLCESYSGSFWNAELVKERSIGKAQLPKKMNPKARFANMGRKHNSNRM